jgi:biotin transport system substrate-specific component
MTPSPIKPIAAVALAGLMALCAQISLPMVPVPMTMQTFAVLLAGALLGPRWGVVSVLVYLAAGAGGLPVFSDGSGGWERLVGPTAGYLFAFPVAAGLVGWAGERGLAVRAIPGLALLTGAHLLILALGAGWLARDMGVGPALAAGSTPFLIGAVAKSALVWIVARAAGWWSRPHRQVDAVQ